MVHVRDQIPINWSRDQPSSYHNDLFFSALLFIFYFFFFFLQFICLIQPEYKHAQYKQIFPIKLYMYFINNCTFTEVIKVQNFTWHFTQSSIYSFLNAGFPKKMTNQFRYLHYNKSSIYVSKNHIAKGTWNII